MPFKSLRFSFRLGLAAIMALSAAAFAQKQPAVGTHITVSKTATAEYPADYKTIQEAVNAARAEQVIEILDESVYEEQVTIDGRENSPWDGKNGGTIKKVVGGKNGITIRYVPPAGTPINSGFKRPTIKYQDKANVFPKTSAQAQTDGELEGNGGNFETCGALRIIRAEGVTIEGIAIDGGGPAPFGYEGVWQSRCTNASALTHGNAAITLVVAGGAVIRNCDIKNAFIGINIKDRNTGGVFGNPNPADNDNTIPLSGFGRVGYHLIEQSRIHNNSVGLFFESAWDLSNTVRYNLIYNNYHSSTLKTTTSGGIDGIPDGGNMIAAAIMFKDMVYTPMAIYNNTFYKNANNLLAHWKVGATHLLFNNIFSEPHTLEAHYMNIDHRFPNRMHNSVLAAQAGTNGLRVQCQDNYDCENGRAPGGCFFGDANITNSFGNVPKERVALRVCNQGQGFTGQTQQQEMAVPGASITGGQQMAFPIPATANVRWLEMTRRDNARALTYDLFESTDPDNAKFLWPKWTDTLVIRLIKNQGWTGANIRNADGQVADIGAISSAGGNNKPLATTARIKPTNVIMVTGRQATASFYLNVDAGKLTNPTIKFLRWVAPLPNACKGDTGCAAAQCNWAGDDGGASAIELRASAIRSLTPPTTVLTAGGTNSLTFTLPEELTAATSYGFFEMVIEGTDANGVTVTTDVGFLPYRRLMQRLEVCVQRGSSWDCDSAVVNVGDAVTLRVTAQERKGGSNTWTAYNELSPREMPVNYRLLSASTSRMWQELTSGGRPRNPLDSTENLVSGNVRTQTYTVYFTKAGAEVISAAGLHDMLPFPGQLRLTVKAGAPDKVAFEYPAPKSDGIITVITGSSPVRVEVRDKYDNPVDVAVPVTIVSDKPNTGMVATSPVSTDPADGVAHFEAQVRGGKSGDLFELYASISVPGASKDRDTAVLRIGRATDQMRVFYYESSPPKRGPEGSTSYWQDDWDVEWVDQNPEARVNNKYPVWVKVLSNVDDVVITDKAEVSDATVCVVASSPHIRFSGTEGGDPIDAPDGFPVTLTAGEAILWITAVDDVPDGSLTVTAKQGTTCAGADNPGINKDTRGGIVFTKPTGGIASAYVKGGGDARPTYVEITFSGVGGSFDVWKKPDKITLRWPGVCAAEVQGVIDYKDDGVTVGVTFAAGSFPEGISSPGSNSGALLTVYGAMDVPESNPALLVDSIGPLIAKPGDYCGGIGQFNSPTFEENTEPGVKSDVLTLQITEALGDPQSLMGNSIMISPDGTGTGTALKVIDVKFNSGVYTLTLDPSTQLTQNYWIRLNPAHPGVADITGNKVHAENRWVQIRETEVPPIIRDAWYTTNDVTGKLDKAYIAFHKAITSKTEWFENGSFTFDWAGIVKGKFGPITSAMTAALEIVSDTILEIDLSMDGVFAAAKALGPTEVMTGGSMPIVIEYGSNRGEWEPATAYARDKANPVLRRAVLQIGSMDDNGNPQPDTLTITYSEAMNDNLDTKERPVSIVYRGDNGTPVILKWESSKPSGTGTEVTYSVMGECIMSSNGCAAPGDSIKIYEDDLVADRAEPTPNVQRNAANKRVPLEIKPGKINWQTRIKNNPFRESTTIVMTPNAKGGQQSFEAEIRLYDNMGKLVIDTKANNTPGDPQNGNALHWTWDGRNANGRSVGTGTYLFKVVCTTDDGVKYMPPTKKIAYVR